MVIPPSTEIILIKSPLESDSLHQMNFANSQSQYNYFISLPHVEFGGCTYQRKDGVVRVPALVDNIRQYNYVMYRNENHGNKWFYAFITGMEYLNDQTTSVKIKTDVFQTWQFDLVYKSTFVEREHVSVDTVGSHTIDEGLSVGELVDNPATLTEMNYGDSFKVCVLMASPLGTTISESLRTYNGIFSGLYPLCMSYSDANKYLRLIPKPSEVVSVFIYPTLMDVNLDPNVFHPTYDTSISIRIPASGTYSSILGTATIERPLSIDGYTPKNNKCFVYPYSSLFVDNNVGQTAEFHWEDFTNTSSANFRVRGAFGQGCSIKLYPTNYKRLNVESESDDLKAYSYGVTGSKLPICSWSSDSYTAYIAQNSVNMAFNTIGQLTQGLPFTAMTQPTGGVVSQGLAIGKNVLGAITYNMQEHLNASRLPDQAHGDVNNADINMATHKHGFTIVNKTMRAERARQIDDYFSMFGYKVNRIKIPNITGRRNWNYVKTTDCYIGGNVPDDDLSEIKNMFNSGLTIWHNPSTFMDYSQNNAII